MTDATHIPMSACPACAAAPSAERLASLVPPRDARMVLSLPGAHCAACMVAVETALQAVPGVRSARVNLTQRRISVDARAGVLAADLNQDGWLDLYVANDGEPNDLYWGADQFPWIESGLPASFHWVEPERRFSLRTVSAARVAGHGASWVFGTT